jgi:hypothetical protein
MIKNNKKKSEDNECEKGVFLGEEGPGYGDVAECRK